MQEKRVAVITGASGALGSTLEVVLRTAGYLTVCLDRAKDGPSGDAAAHFGGVDLAEPAAVAQVVADVGARFGRIDALFNVAGTFRFETISGGSVDTWELLQRVNVRTALVTTQAVLPWLAKQGGRIVNVGSVAGHAAASGMGPYAASKASIHRFTESLADELKGRGITVNAVLPSTIDTPANRRDLPDADFARWVTREEVAAVMLFLASDAASGVTGALVPVPGRV